MFNTFSGRLWRPDDPGGGGAGGGARRDVIRGQGGVSVGYPLGGHQGAGVPRLDRPEHGNCHPGLGHDSIQNHLILFTLDLYLNVVPYICIKKLVITFVLIFSHCSYVKV